MEWNWEKCVGIAKFSDWIEKNWARVGSREAKKSDSTVYLAAKVAHCTEIEQE